MPSISRAINHNRHTRKTSGPDHDIHCEGCGANLKTRHCCYCGRTYSTKWWSEQTGEVEQVLRHFSYLDGIKFCDSKIGGDGVLVTQTADNEAW